MSSAARYTEGSVIPTPFFPDSDRPEVQSFVRAFKQEYNSEPGQFEAYGYEAGTLLLTLMDRYHVSTREELVQLLGNLGVYTGVTGRFSFDADGEYKSEPALLTVEGAEFKLVH